MNSNHYFSNAGQLFKALLKGEFKEQTRGNFSYSRTDVGICSAHCILGLPVVITQWNPNFKKKIYFCGLPLFTQVRKQLSLNQGEQYQIDNGRKPRLYIHIGGLPFFDNRSGIPRVSKKLTEEGLKNPDVDVLPVYPDPRDGTYRIALSWIKQMGYTDPQMNGLDGTNPLKDPVMTIREGDWFIHSMINPNELEFEYQKLQAMRDVGVKVGFILYDIIAERSPNYFKKRDAKTFSRWLRMIDRFDGIFAISETVLNDYQSWRQEQNLPDLKCPLKWFHLGADFKKVQGRLSANDEEQLARIRQHDYYLQVSTIEPRKGYRQLLDAFDCLWNEGSDLAVVFVGRKGWKVNDLCHRIKKHPQFNKKLFWLSGVSDGFLTTLYSNAKGVIVASENEGFGLSVAEGAFYGKPLLVRDIPVFREVAKDAGNYFRGTGGEDLAKAIKEIDSLTPLTRKGMKTLNDVQMPTWTECFESFCKLL